MIPAHRRRPFNRPLRQFPPQHESPERSPQPEASKEDRFAPTYADVCVARMMLKALKLPTEIALQVLEYARYWPEHTFHCDVTVEGGRTGTSNVFAKPCIQVSIWDERIKKEVCGGTENVKVKEIEFEIESHDQGWTSQSSKGTFDTSSWTEVSLLRYLPESEGPHSSPPNIMHFDYRTPEDMQRPGQLPNGWALVERPASSNQGPQAGEGPYAWYLQGNRVAARHEPPYRITWAPDRFEGNEGAGKPKDFFDALREGDFLVIWARAKWPGWTCTVVRTKVTVRYGF